MSDPEITLRSVDGDRTAFVPLLLEADESEPVVRAYLDDGDLLEVVANGQPVGVVLLTSPEVAAIEIKNIAIRRENRGGGMGRAAIGCIAAHAPARGANRVMVGTADSSGGTMAFCRTQHGRPKGLHYY
jgi:hypothetical protein